MSLRQSRERRTIGAFRDDPVPRRLVEELIDSAVWAPNHKHTEPWRFHVVQGDARDALADAVWAELDAAGASPAKDPRNKLKRAPLFVAVTQTASPTTRCATSRTTPPAAAPPKPCCSPPTPAASPPSGAPARSPSQAPPSAGSASTSRTASSATSTSATPPGRPHPPRQPLPNPRRLAHIANLRTRRIPPPPEGRGVSTCSGASWERSNRNPLPPRSGGEMSRRDRGGAFGRTRLRRANGHHRLQSPHAGPSQRFAPFQTLRHSRAPSRHSRAPSVIPAAPPRHSRAPPVIPAPPPVIPAQAGIQATAQPSPRHRTGDGLAAIRPRAVEHSRPNTPIVRLASCLRSACP